jgi:tetratricopeptide (TPR) repeat protein
VFLISAVLLLNRTCVYTPDSASYLTLSLSMARGSGYRDIGMPGDPAQLTYPPVFPLMLLPAAVVLPGNIILAGKALNILIGLLALVLLYRLLRRLYPPGRSALILAATALNPFFVQHSAEVMSEPAYSLFSTAALLLMLRVGEDAGMARPFGAGLAAGLALLTRLIGVSVVFSGAVFYCAGAVRRKAAVFLSAVVLIAAPWALANWLGLSHAGGLNAWPYWADLARSLPSGASVWVELRGAVADDFLYYLPGLARVMYPFLFLSETGLGDSLAPVFSDWFNFPSLIGTFAAGLTLLAAAAGGLRLMRDRMKRPVVLYLAAYMAVLILYPSRQLRLLLPMLPFFWLAVLEGGDAIRASIGERARYFRRKAVLLRGLPWAAYFAASLVLLAGLVITNLSFCGVPGFRVPATGRFKYGLTEPAAWLAAHTPPDSVVLCGRAELFLLSGRKTVGGGQYEAVLGKFEQNLRGYKVSHIVSAAPSGISELHRLMADALMFDFRKEADFQGAQIHAVMPRDKPRKPYLENYDRVVAERSRDVAARPADLEAHRELGYFYFKQLKYAAAAAEFRIALELDPECPVTWFNLGSALLDGGDYDGAVFAFEKALSVKSAYLISGLARPSIALARIKKELRELPGDPRNYERSMEAAELYFNMKEYSKAITELAGASALRPDLAEPLFRMGECYEAQGGKEEALKAYRGAVKLRPGDAAASAALRRLEAGR